MIKPGQSKAAKAENMSENTGVTNEVMHFPDREYGSRSGSFYKMHVVFVIDNTVQPPSPGMGVGKGGQVKTKMGYDFWSPAAQARLMFHCRHWLIVLKLQTF